MKPTRTFDLLERYFRLFPGNNALAEKKDGRWIEYSVEKYIELSHLFARGLLQTGMSRGDKIVTISNNRPEWNFADMGMAMVGIVHVPVYTSLSAEEYSYIFEHSDARLVIVSDQKLYDTVKGICKKNKKIEKLLTFNEIPGVGCWTDIILEGRRSGNEIIEMVDFLKSDIKPAEVASIIYTSGTTGRSKGVMLTHRNLCENFIAAAEVFSLTPSDRFMSILPLCHVGGRMGNYQTQYSGACIYYCENMGTIAVNLREVKATGFDAVPRVLEKIFDTVMAKGRSLSGIKKRLFFWAVSLGLKYEPFGAKSSFYYFKLKIADKLIFSKWREALGGSARIVGCGGASLQPRLERVFWASGLKILNMYGLTETSPIITINRQHKEMCRLGSVGALIDGVEVKIADDGEILCRGHNVMAGYYKDEELTRSVFDEDGWFHTGDVGHMEDGKFLMVTDRKKEIFKLSSGKFIAPQLIENKLKESLLIDQAMVIGEHQKLASALIVPDFEYLRQWYKSLNRKEAVSNEELINMTEVVALMQKEISIINKKLPEHERMGKTRMVADVWSPASGELSASLKLKRKVIGVKYKSQIDAIYPRSI